MDPIEFAKYQRRTARSYDQLLWQLLRNRERCGMKFRRQHPLGIYTADFYCAEAKLVIEIDGSPHQTAESKRKDQARDAWMHLQGIAVLRFGGWQVESETQSVLQCIDDTLRQRSPAKKASANQDPCSPLPGTPGRGAGGEGLTPRSLDPPRGPSKPDARPR